MSLNYDSQVIERVKAAEKFNDRFQKTKANTRNVNGKYFPAKNGIYFPAYLGK